MTEPQPEPQTPPSEPAPALVDRQNPWPGLSSYTESAQGYFFGRETEIRDILSRIEARPFTLLYAKSGLGKTSLLQAGIAPSLKKRRLLPVPLRLDYVPKAPEIDTQIARALLTALANAGAPAPARAPLAAPGEGLWEWLHRTDTKLVDAAGQPLTPVLILDQFEEMFTLGDRDAAARARSHRWLQSLAYLVENWCPAEVKERMEQNEELLEEIDIGRPALRVLISLREDYLPHLDERVDEMPSIPVNRMRLTPLRGTQALEVVHQPAPELVTRKVAEAIVRFASGDNESELAEIQVAPPILNLVCRELNERRKGRGLAAITPDLIEGDAGKILRQFYEECIKSHPPAVRAFVEDELLSDSGFRENISEERAQRYMAEAGVPASALEDLISRRLLQKEERLGRFRLELIHDVLCAPIAQSRSERHLREKAASDEAERQRALAKIRQLHLRAALYLTGFIISLGLLVYALVEKKEAADQARIAAEKSVAAAQESNRADTYQNTIALDETLALIFGIKNFGHPEQLAEQKTTTTADAPAAPAIDDAISTTDLKNFFDSVPDSATDTREWFGKGYLYAREAAFEMSAYNPPHESAAADSMAQAKAVADKLAAKKNDQDADRFAYVLYAFLIKPAGLMGKTAEADAFEKKAFDAAVLLKDPSDAEYAASLIAEYYYENVESKDRTRPGAHTALDDSIDHAQKSVDAEKAKGLVNWKHLNQLAAMLGTRSDKLDDANKTAEALRDATAAREALEIVHRNFDEDWKDQPAKRFNQRETLAKAYTREGQLCQSMKGDDACWAQGRASLVNAVSTYNSLIPGPGVTVSPELKASTNFDDFRQNAAIACRVLGDYDMAWSARADIKQQAREDSWKQAENAYNQSMRIAADLPAENDYYQLTKAYGANSLARLTGAKIKFTSDVAAILSLCKDYVAQSSKAIDIIEAGQGAGSRAWHDYDQGLNGVTVDDAIAADKTGNYRSNLAGYYGNISFRLLFLGKFPEALQDAKKGLMIDESQKWIITNLAHANLFLGNVTLARQLYGIYANVKMNDTLFSDYVRQDFDALKHVNVTHPNMDDILHDLDVAAKSKGPGASPAPGQSPAASPSPAAAASPAKP